MGGDGIGEVRQAVAGGYQEGRTFVPADAAYSMLVRETPQPRTHGTEPWRLFRRHRLRNALSAWYLRDRVELPVSEEQQRRIQAVTADPEEAEKAEKTEQAEQEEQGSATAG
jgi:ubiquinol-cytochrome c reductase cytochrome b subunit